MSKPCCCSSCCINEANRWRTTWVSLKLSLVVATTRLVPVKMKIKGVTDSNSEYRCSCGSEDSYSICIDDEYEDEKGGSKMRKSKVRLTMKACAAWRRQSLTLRQSILSLKTPLGKKQSMSVLKLWCMGSSPKWIGNFPQSVPQFQKGTNILFFFFFLIHFYIPQWVLNPWPLPPSHVWVRS